eukprot:TRINITY_DN82925_c0_g1_i1.p1 TRINITY_DN82925_c0_g1~~TRINITY_DN82925_c0_g1_i1.p1  ORF type:complete len:292 (-),score=58.42 TRINITY_DN82925_c0_g1_i1:4-879(-)
MLSRMARRSPQQQRLLGSGCLGRLRHQSSQKTESTDALLLEIRDLKAMVSTLHHDHRIHTERVQKQIEANVARLERNYRQVEESKTLHARSQKLLHSLLELRELKVRGVSLVNRWTITGLLIFSLVGWSIRHHIYKQVGKEAAEMASAALEQEKLIETAVATLNAIAKDPETLHSLVDLLDQLLKNPGTRAALVEILVWTFQQDQILASLIELLMWVFSDQALTTKTGEFLMKALDDPSAKQMLHSQTAELVRATVLDQRVQRDTGVGIKAATLWATTPRVLTKSWWTGSE